MKSHANKIIPWFVFSLLLAVMLACGSTQPLPVAIETPNIPPTEAFSPTFTPIPIFTVVNLASKPTEETGKSPDYILKAQTPFFQGSEDLRVVNFNNEMALLTQEEIAKFKDNVVQVTPLPGSTGSFYDQQYKLLSPPGNIVSLKFQIMIYIQGAAHPGTHFRTVTYDLETGSDMRLAQLFLSGSDYLEKIANYCIAQLSTRDIGFDASSNGAQPVPEKYGNWNITSDGLMITFDEYQVAAYAAGPQEVVVPYTELSSVIDPQGPLGVFLP
jgi:Protein of unknown function (DUF3298)